MYKYIYNVGVSMHTSHKYTYTHAYMHTCMHACLHTYVHARTYIHTYIYIYITAAWRKTVDNAALVISNTRAGMATTTVGVATLAVLTLKWW